MKKFVFFMLLFFVTFNGFCPLNYLDDLKIQDYIEKCKKEQRINNLMKAIRVIESRENYQARGSGTDYGAYQFVSETWNYYCLLFTGTLMDIRDPENQDQIARLKITYLVDQGCTDEQIASIWNCGSSKWKGKKGINKNGVPYDVPKYVKKVKQIINSLNS